MTSHPLGPFVPAQKAIQPSRVPIHGNYTSILPLSLSHASSIYKHLGGPENSHLWTYMNTVGFPTYEDCEESIAEWSRNPSPDTIYYAVFSGPVTDPSAEPVGMVCYLTITPAHRRIEIGGVILSKALKQTRQATEAFYLLLKHAFELRYLRVEWKANNLNQASLKAAERLGFTFEGVFRKHMVVKGRERDTAWFSITDTEWESGVKQGLEDWLDEKNFDKQGRQIEKLKECRDARKNNLKT